MAKHLHRVFELYDSPDEAILQLTPRVAKTDVETTAPETWDFEHLAVSRTGGVTQVEFKPPQELGADQVKEVTADLTQLAEKLDRDSKVLVNFTGVETVHPAIVAALALFAKRLQNRGSCLALCALNETARESL